MTHFKIKKVEGEDNLWEILYRGFFRYRPSNYGVFASLNDAADTLLNDYKGEGIIIHYENI
jgi:hypothetical protein